MRQTEGNKKSVHGLSGLCHESDELVEHLLRGRGKTLEKHAEHNLIRFLADIPDGTCKVVFSFRPGELHPYLYLLVDLYQAVKGVPFRLGDLYHRLTPLTADIYDYNVHYVVVEHGGRPQNALVARAWAHDQLRDSLGGFY